MDIGAVTKPTAMGAGPRHGRAMPRRSKCQANAVGYYAPILDHRKTWSVYCSTAPSLAPAITDGRSGYAVAFRSKRGSRWRRPACWEQARDEAVELINRLESFPEE